MAAGGAQGAGPANAESMAQEQEIQPRQSPVFPAAVSRFVRVLWVFGGQKVGYHEGWVTSLALVI